MRVDISGVSRAVKSWPSTGGLSIRALCELHNRARSEVSSLLSRSASRISCAHLGNQLSPPARSTGLEILRAMSGGGMRQIEDELTEGHKVPTREPAAVLIGSEWLLRLGSGAG